MVYFYPTFCSRLRVVLAMLQKLAPIGSSIFSGLLPTYEADCPTKTTVVAMTFHF